MTRMSFSCVFFLCFASFCACNETTCENSDCKRSQLLAEIADEEHGIKMLQVKGSKMAVRKDDPAPEAASDKVDQLNCPMLEAPIAQPKGKGCPELADSCLNGNKQYTALEQAWKACAKEQECGAILATLEGNFYLRRLSDPDLPEGGTSKLIMFSCPAKDALEKRQHAEKDLENKDDGPLPKAEEGSQFQKQSDTEEHDETESKSDEHAASANVDKEYEKKMEKLAQKESDSEEHDGTASEREEQAAFAKLHKNYEKRMEKLAQKESDSEEDAGTESKSEEQATLAKVHKDYEKRMEKLAQKESESEELAPAANVEEEVDASDGSEFEEHAKRTYESEERAASPVADRENEKKIGKFAQELDSEEQTSEEEVEASEESEFEENAETESEIQNQAASANAEEEAASALKDNAETDSALKEESQTEESEQTLTMTASEIGNALVECPMLDNLNIQPHGKGCPGDGKDTSKCLNENKAYKSRQEAWVACVGNDDCGAILEDTFGSYYLRRDSDPDLPPGDDSKTIQFNCPALQLQRRTRDVERKEEEDKRAKEALDREAYTRCPMPDAPMSLPHGKGCPAGGAEDSVFGSTSCLNGNKQYDSIEEAWLTCAEVAGCGAILQNSDGKFLLRRTSDPDIPQKAGAGYTTVVFSCPKLEGGSLKEAELEDEIKALKEEMSQPKVAVESAPKVTVETTPKDFVAHMPEPGREEASKPVPMEAVGRCMVKITGNTTWCAKVPKNKWFADDDFGGMLGERATQSACSKRDWDKMCGAEVEYRIEAPLPKKAGCHVLIPNGCARHTSFVKGAWLADTFQHSNINKSRCEQRKAEYDRWCGIEDVKVVFNEVSAPSNPGCYVLTPSGCPRHADFNAIQWKEDNHYGSGGSQERCEQRKAEFDRWCGITDSKLIFNVAESQQVEPAQQEEPAQQVEPARQPRVQAAVPSKMKEVTAHAYHANLHKMYAMSKNTLCGWDDSDVQCQMDNQAWVNAGDRSKNNVAREHAMHACGRICAEAGSECAGFVWQAATRMCHFRKNAACGSRPAEGFDCFEKKMRFAQSLLEQ